jgi:hypothetical protein
VFIVIGILDAIKRSEYQNVGMNTPVVSIAVPGFMAGVAAFVIGLKKMKAVK